MGGWAVGRAPCGQRAARELGQSAARALSARPLRAARSPPATNTCHTHTHGLTFVMDKRAPSARGEPFPSILKKPKGWRKGDLLDKSTKIKREKVESSKNKNVSAPLPQGCTSLMYACQQADYKAVVEILNKDVSFRRTRRIKCFECLVIIIVYRKHFFYILSNSSHHSHLTHDFSEGFVMLQIVHVT